MRFLTFAILLVAAGAVQADILHLNDGSRYYGKLIDRDDSTVTFKVMFADGKSGVVRRFAADRIARVERSRRNTPPSTDAKRMTEDDGSAEDFEQMVREAFELIDDDDSASALRALQRVVTRADEPELERLSKLVTTVRSKSLAELLAELRVSQAIEKGRGRAIKLNFATRYETAALLEILSARQQVLLARIHKGRTIAQWAQDREAYEALHSGAQHMVADAQLAAGMVGQRLKRDRSLRHNPNERRRLSDLRTALGRFAARVSCMRGYSGLGGNQNAGDPALAEKRRLAALRPTSRPSTQEADKPDSLPESLFEGDEP